MGVREPGPQPLSNLDARLRVQMRLELANLRQGSIGEVGIRPEHLKIANAGDKSASFNGTISIVERLGNSTILYVDTAAGPLINEGEGSLDAKSGETVGLMMDSKHTHLFGADAQAV